MENRENKSGSVFKTAFPVAAIWLGTQAGPAVASGQFSVSYMAVFGAWGIIVPILASLIVAIGFYNVGEIVRKYNCKDYSQVFAIYMGPLGKIKPLIAFNDVMQIYGLMISGAMTMAVVGQLAEGFGITKWVGYTIATIVLILFAMYGVELLKKLNSTITICLLIAFTVLAVLAITHSQGSISISRILGEWHIPEGSAGLSGALYRAFMWGCGSVGFAMQACMAMNKYNSKKCSAAGAVLGFILNAGLLLLGLFAVYAFYPEILSESAPNLIIATRLASMYPWMNTMYIVVMILALISTDVTFIVMLQARFGHVVYKNTKISEKLQTASFGVVFCVLISVVSGFGLVAIVTKAMLVTQYWGLLFTALPLVVIWSARSLLKTNSDDKVTADEKE